MPRPLRIAITLLLTGLLSGCAGATAFNSGFTQQQSLQTLDQASRLGSNSRN